MHRDNPGSPPGNGQGHTGKVWPQRLSELNEFATFRTGIKFWDFNLSAGRRGFNGPPC